MKVSLTMLLKTNVEKMSALGFATMFMKTQDLYHFATMLMKMKVVSSRKPAAGCVDSSSDDVGSKWTQKCYPLRVALEIGPTVTIDLKNPPNPRGSNA